MQTTITITVNTEGEQDGANYHTPAKQMYDALSNLHDVIVGVPTLYDTGITVPTASADGPLGEFNLMEDLPAFEEPQE